MKTTLQLLLACSICFLASAQYSKAENNKLSKDEIKDGWALLFNGENLDDWKGAEKPDSFSVKDGELVIKGDRGHLFYRGSLNNAKFKDFHLKAEVKTTKKSNSGIYFHTEYQAHDWPKKGYEAQVNNSGKDKKRTGGLYDAANNFDEVAKDDTWFSYDIIVEGNHVITKIDGKIITDYREAKDVSFPGWPGRRLSEGTFAIQAHDPKSVVYYRNIKVKTIAENKGNSNSTSSSEFVDISHMEKVWGNVNMTVTGRLPDVQESKHFVAQTTEGTITASGEGFPNEGPKNMFDNNPKTKFCIKSKELWVQIHNKDDAKNKIEKYALVSANDNSTRDPKDWKLLGSNNGKDWTTVDEQKNQRFNKRFERREFKVANPGKYSYYKLLVTMNHNNDTHQIADLELIK